MTILIWIAVLIVVGSILMYFREFITSVWQDGGRGQFLVMGMPAVVCMVLGVAALGLAAVNLDGLDLHYKNLSQRANDEAQKLRDEIRTNRQAIGGAQDKTDQDVLKELEAVQAKQQIYLEKLISLDPEDPAHKYEHALLAFNQRDPQRALNLMQLIAPFDNPGYAPGHLFLASYFLRQRSNSSQAAQVNLQRANLQIANCLIADKNNIEAKKIEAYILERTGKFQPAFAKHLELIETDPVHYQDLVRLAKRAGRETQAETSLISASQRYRTKIKNSTDNVADWVDAWKHFVNCMKLRKNAKSFDDAEAEVKAELIKYNDDIVKKGFLQQLLSGIYTDKVRLIGRDGSPEERKKQLEYLANAIENNESNPSALTWLTILSFTDLGEQARKIYDPLSDRDPPWTVLAELGKNAMDIEDYDNAITYYERARKKQPNNSQLLNNLAFALLKAPESRSPEQALILIDQAIFHLQSSARADIDEEAFKNISASFFDTRGVALSELGRHKEAAAAFEIAFRGKPNSEAIIKRLIKSYENLDNEPQAASFRRRLEKLNSSEKQNQ